MGSWLDLSETEGYITENIEWGKKLRNKGRKRSDFHEFVVNWHPGDIANMSDVESPDISELEYAPPPDVWGFKCYR